MAGIPFSKPVPEAATAYVATFTLEEANRALPLVRSIVSDLVITYQRLSQLRAKRELIGVPDKTSEDRIPADEIRGASQRLDGFLKELSDLGLRLEDLESGLVDFPGSRNGERVSFCWRLGEPEVRHWHPVKGTFADRRPVDEACA